MGGRRFGVGQSESFERRRLIGEYAQADAAQARAAMPPPKAAPAWAAGSIQERSNLLDRVGTEILARKDELGKLSRAKKARHCPKV
jgi:aldehyde dehydrogenase (NAD+)